MDDQEKEDLKDTIRELLREIIADAQDPAFQPIAEADPDKVGILAASNLFRWVAEFLSDLDEDLAAYDYKISLSNAYGILSGSILWGMDAGILSDDWSAVCDLFAQREGEFIGSPEVDIEFLSGDLYKWVYAVDRLFLKWKLADAGGSTFSDADRVLFFRSFLLLLRDIRYLEYEGWVKELIASLEVDWRIMGGGFPSAIDPTYVPPWSGG